MEITTIRSSTRPTFTNTALQKLDREWSEMSSDGRIRPSPFRPHPNGRLLILFLQRSVKHGAVSVVLVAELVVELAPRPLLAPAHIKVFNGGWAAQHAGQPGSGV